MFGLLASAFRYSSLKELLNFRSTSKRMSTNSTSNLIARVKVLTKQWHSKCPWNPVLQLMSCCFHSLHVSCWAFSFFVAKAQLTSEETYQLPEANFSPSYPQQFSCYRIKSRRSNSYGCLNNFSRPFSYCIIKMELPLVLMKEVNLYPILWEAMLWKMKKAKAIIWW